MNKEILKNLAYEALQTSTLFNNSNDLNLELCNYSEWSCKSNKEKIPSKHLDVESNLLCLESFDINLDDANLDYDFLYFEKELPQILAGSQIKEVTEYDDSKNANSIFHIDNHSSNIREGPSEYLESRKFNINLMETTNPTNLKNSRKSDKVKCNKETVYLISQDRDSKNNDPPEENKDCQENKCDQLRLDNNDLTTLNFKFCLTEPIQTDSLLSFIMENYIMKIQNQQGIDFADTVIKKIGRPSSSKFMKSSDINKMMRALLKEKLINLICRDNSLYRSDLFMIEYFRIIRKIPNFYVKNFATQINVKSSELRKFTLGFKEAASAYQFSRGNLASSDIIKKVVEFSVIYFSESKCRRLIGELLSTLKSTKSRADITLMKHISHQLEVLNMRKKLSIKTMGNLASKSETMREILNISMDALSEINSSSLCKTARELKIVSEGYKPNKDICYCITKGKKDKGNWFEY